MYNPDTVIKTIHVDSQEKSADVYGTLPVSVNYVTPAPVPGQVTVLEKAVGIVEPLVTIEIDGYGPSSDVNLFDKNFFKYFTDTLILVDTMALDDDGQLVDSTTVSESLAKGMGAYLSEGTTVTENFSIVAVFNLAFSDLAEIAETLSNGLGQAFQDSTAITEVAVPRISLIATGNDTATLTETLSKSIDNSISESTSLSETFSLKYSAALSDTTALVETFTRLVDFQRPLLESTELVDMFERTSDYRRSLDDATASVEVFEKAIYKPDLSDSTAITETFVKALSVSISETTAISETKSLALFSYVAYDYFSSDYVASIIT